jgi:ribosomal protein L11
MESIQKTTKTTEVDLEHTTARTRFSHLINKLEDCFRRTLQRYMKTESISSKTKNETIRRILIQQCKEIVNFKKKELKQNQKSYRHKNLVNGRSPMQFKHTVAHICNTRLKIQI